MKKVLLSLLLLLPLVVSGCRENGSVRGTAGEIARRQSTAHPRGAAVVGITTDFLNGYDRVNDNYSVSVERAGGVPVLLPLARSAEQAAATVGLLDALILTGGEDVQPERYGESPLNSTVKSNPARDSSEFLLLEAARAKGIPVLGTCRGEQLVNVAFGGSLYQDLPTQLDGCLKHRQDTVGTVGTHWVYLQKGSRLRSLLGVDSVLVNSFHHQGVKKLGKGLRASARASDGLIEAYEGDGVMCVQFHPEMFTAAGSDVFLPLYLDLVGAPLPDPLVKENGRRVRRAGQWPSRRAEILEILQSEMYGRIPPEPEAIETEIIEQGPTLGGLGVRTQVREWFRKDKTGPYINWLMVEPAAVQEPVPAVILLNINGNHTVVSDPEVLPPHGWMSALYVPTPGTNFSDGSDRGKYAGEGERYAFPLRMLLERGYAFVTAGYADVSPDPSKVDDATMELQHTLAYTGVFDLWGPRDSTRTDNPTSLGAWAWALSRGLDMLEKDPRIDASRVVVTGCSRLGKAALLAGAADERFAVVAPVETGGGGAPLQRHIYGENIATMMRDFTHWYCPAFGKYAGREEDLPFDQHMLLSLVAPRPLLVLGFDQPWFDTRGEFLAVQAASPVWELLGGGGVPQVGFPDDFDTSAIGERLGYARRSGPHGIALWDWQTMLDFADRQFDMN